MRSGAAAGFICLAQRWISYPNVCIIIRHTRAHLVLSYRDRPGIPTKVSRYILRSTCNVSPVQFFTGFS